MNFIDRLDDMYDKLDKAGVIRWPVQAAALSYYCILGLVPFLALCFSVAKSFGLDADLYSTIDGWADRTFGGLDEQYQDVVYQIIAMIKGFTENLIANFSGGIVAFVALGVIFWACYRLLALLEDIFGRIFGYHPPRRPIHRVMDYFTVMVIVPLVLMAALTIKIYLTGLAAETWEIPLGLDPSSFISIFIILSPYVILWLVLSWAYAYFSRGLVRWRERLLGGFVASLVVQLFLTFYLSIMFALSSYSAIYAGFAAVPLCLIALYSSWLIVLGGGELTRRFYDFFAGSHGFFSLVTPATWRNTVDLARAVMAEVVRNYQAESGGGATSFKQLTLATQSPLPSLGSVVNRLLLAHLLVRISGPMDDGPSFLPARGPELITDEFLVQALENGFIEIG
ncbi:MAG: YihY/virulence factor BrkB family protein [Candidatus Adiutrix sp.]|nr:YihY/virulence factor BrkB family protein [Candidatus Adiutrix sp.]